MFFIKTKLTNIPRPKGSQNKITSEVKEKIQLLIDDLIAIVRGFSVDSIPIQPEKKYSCSGVAVIVTTDPDS